MLNVSPLSFKAVTMKFRVRVLFLLLLCLSLFTAMPVAQSAEPDRNTAENADRDEPLQREQWFRHGRMVPGENAADLRFQAHRSRMQMRTVRRFSPAAGLLASTPVGVWTSLGPSPLASDATGIGAQDYGWVSGRATAVAIDPADSTGNTVYAGGAYGGVWKSKFRGSPTFSGRTLWPCAMTSSATQARSRMA